MKNNIISKLIKKTNEMNVSGDFQLDSKVETSDDNETTTELQTFEIIVGTLSSEVTVQFWVLVLFAVVIFVVLLS